MQKNKKYNNSKINLNFMQINRKIMIEVNKKIQ